ncbi:response regulator transcription factor [Sulfitobacter pseudonitzschiae]|uniref:Response regulator transcription factor n=1 Tax=Pseudosulfitobacter pseudonitzschiae TaxID=1402135 RepID=A0A9Q2RW56_9RHOB|nr:MULTISPECIES: response regulator transcription factor [Roseobacteraceae]MBM2291068.1 response regulator transcription factor [Pseudosulfitobacter pseudonitzschiae]MBM2295986.1 response regulator transcription factor [Pseudosulfitobacter pseudonitzschiae]MBM2300899.1 response regulator transcription factor [Pseudosulfitobacter pseudonitzschiae]MBM2310683.1 response regulator transcription factor [Pseudosulfitobacter pseudonitzschiae]MBM2315596.1 response regulator transcription factor [Pseud|tara:strand:- start:561 stop:1217 length:657 start_codon:yes stop_codon:yes gene_type:complete
MTELTPLPHPIRVLVVDDHPMVAQGIQSILESYDDLMVVGTLGNGRDVINQLDTLKPHVILMDLNMPEMGGLTATELVLERSPDTAVLILSMHDSPEYIASALDHGARGYVLKDVPTDEIKDAIDAVMRGERYLCTGAQGSIEPKSGDIRSQLTDREQTILLQLAQGLSNKDVARDLDISVRTVETHRKNIKRKLGISSTAGLTRYAMEHGVLQGTGR